MSEHRTLANTGGSPIVSRSPDPRVPPLAAAIAALAKADGRTRIRIAAAAGVPQQTFARIVHGEVVRPNVGHVARLSRALGLSPAALGQLLYDAFPDPRPASTRENLLPSEPRPRRAAGARARSES
jgi:transcriptional regulator with XRE-family HTH domain